MYIKVLQMFREKYDRKKL